MRLDKSALDLPRIPSLSLTLYFKPFALQWRIQGGTAGPSWNGAYFCSATLSWRTYQEIVKKSLLQARWILAWTLQVEQPSWLAHSQNLDTGKFLVTIVMQVILSCYSYSHRYDGWSLFFFVINLNVTHDIQLSLAHGEFLYKLPPTISESGDTQLPVTPTSAMRRFTEALLLVACIVLPPLFVNGLQALQATTKYMPTIQRNGVIRGLLVSRQGGTCPNGFGICPSLTCCPIGGKCCNSSSFLSIFWVPLPS